MINFNYCRGIIISVVYEVLQSGLVLHNFNLEFWLCAPFCHGKVCRRQRLKHIKKKHNLRLNIIQYFQEPAGCEYKIKYILFFFTIYSFLLMTE